MGMIALDTVLLGWKAPLLGGKLEVQIPRVPHGTLEYLDLPTLQKFCRFIVSETAKVRQKWCSTIQVQLH